MFLLRWIGRRIWKSQVRKYRVLSRLVTAVAVLRWVRNRRSGVRRVVLAEGENLVVGIERRGPGS